MPQLDSGYYISQIFWLNICFSIIYLVFARILYPELIKVLEDRDNKTKKLHAKNRELLESIKKIIIDTDNTVKDTYKRISESKNNLEIELKNSIEARIKTFSDYESEKNSDARQKINLLLQKSQNDIDNTVVKIATSLINKTTNESPDQRRLKEIYSLIK